MSSAHAMSFAERRSYLPPFPDQGAAPAPGLYRYEQDSPPCTTWHANGANNRPYSCKRINSALQVTECVLHHQTFDWKADVSLKCDLIYFPGHRLESIVHVRAADNSKSRGLHTRHNNNNNKKRSLPSSPEGSVPSSPTNPLPIPAAAVAIARADVAQHNKKPRCSSSVSSVDGQGTNVLLL